MVKKTPTPSDYSQALEAIKNRVRAAQYDALKAVNLQLITLYWDIGRIIVDRQQEKNWGKSVVERLGTDLRQEFPGLRGFSARNIWYMRKFYLCYRENQKLQPMVAEIGWTHNLIIVHGNWKQVFLESLWPWVRYGQSGPDEKVLSALPS